LLLSAQKSSASHQRTSEHRNARSEQPHNVASKWNIQALP
jgi:hypothetical protein